MSGALKARIILQNFNAFTVVASFSNSRSYMIPLHMIVIPEHESVYKASKVGDPVTHLSFYTPRDYLLNTPHYQNFPHPQNCNNPVSV